ncbi:1,2-phenylacetyl-CoA epoxidase subunit PaaD [Aegicerativicinus sediminis]|uniref:1,2-phenylacetyl-CoA epoxidase subunit PaaD n=1 Tax=Aegicerativicinus sediminis TaxID=2893202 RepID=UPI001E4AEBCE|nr:1,2-phenylacetyl-CoA epoxidase subunit PaaD [Aegicerativicinus sediminis]
MTVEQVNIDQELIPLLEQVSDPEIPVLSVLDLGIIRTATIENNLVKLQITPTYSGCPAMDTVADDLKAALKNKGYNAEIELVLTPAWTTDFISEKGRKALENYGIAAPLEENLDKQVLLGKANLIACPQCGSKNTKMISQFGSTPCKALFKCNDCQEPFDYFKCLK